MTTWCSCRYLFSWIWYHYVAMFQINWLTWMVKTTSYYQNKLEKPIKIITAILKQTNFVKAYNKPDFLLSEFLKQLVWVSLLMPILFTRRFRQEEVRLAKDYTLLVSEWSSQDLNVSSMVVSQPLQASGSYLFRSHCMWHFLHGLWMHFWGSTVLKLSFWSVIIKSCSVI